MSGFYNNWVKVNNPTLSNDIPAMRSNGFQVPFYFGGSNVPTSLGLEKGSYSGSGIKPDVFDIRPTMPKAQKGRQETGLHYGSRRMKPNILPSITK